MRSRLGGLAVALALGLGACGSDGGEIGAPHPAHRASAIDADLVSARDTLPPAPSPADALTVVLTHPAGALDPGLDAAAAALAQRPDIEVVIAVAGEPGAETMSGFPVAVTDATAAGAVAAALDTDPGVDLVVVGIADGHGIGSSSPEAATATARDVPALVVGAEHADPPDVAGAAMQLLEMLDLESGTVLEGGDAYRLAVPSCTEGMLRGRLATRAGAVPADLAADCTSDEVPDDLEAVAFAHGYATVTRLG